ncbi:MAG TPA: adenylate/guanylate cyclase domain-containing protein, partial [Bacteroidales bacterium]
MVNTAKYKNNTNILPKYFALFLAIGCCLYASSSSNVTLREENITSQPASYATENYSGHHAKTLFITTESGILVFDGRAWKLVPVSGRYIVNMDHINNLLIGSESFIGRLKLPVSNDNPTIDTIVLSKHFSNWEMPEKIFTLNGKSYLVTQNFLYRIDSRRLVLLDSSQNGVLVFPGKSEIIVKKGNYVIKLGENTRDTLSECPYLPEHDLSIKFYEVAGEDLAKKPFYFRWWAWTLYGAIIITLVFLYWLRRRHDFEREKAKLEQIIKERTAELMREKEKTDELLANLLPKDTADELKNTGKATSQKFEMVTVLFSDIQGFTKIAEQMNPEKLIDELDNFFFHFDSVVEKYNIEKIKTIGDAYMCAGGIPYKNRTNPVEVVLAAVEIQEYMRQLKLKNNHIWDLRIGIHTGAVIAGVVGHKRMSYDIWGDTVNTA